MKLGLLVCRDESDPDLDRQVWLGPSVPIPALLERTTLVVATIEHLRKTYAARVDLVWSGVCWAKKLERLGQGGWELLKLEQKEIRWANEGGRGWKTDYAARLKAD